MSDLRVVKAGRSLREVAGTSDYYLGKPADITVGLWPLLWSLVPPVGIILSIRAIIFGSRRRRGAIAALGVVALLSSLLVGALFVASIPHWGEIAGINSNSLQVDGEEYRDNEGRRYLVPKGMTLINETTAGTWFGRHETDESGYARVTSDRYAVLSTEIESSELARALTAITDERSDEHAIWWGRLVSDFAQTPHKIAAHATQGPITYVDVDLLTSGQTDEPNRLAIAVQDVDGVVVAQLLAYTSYGPIGVIDQQSDVWRRMVESMKSDRTTSSRETTR